MIYAAFTVWLFAILPVGWGVYRLWAGMLRPAWVNWALLPGTVVSEMAYIFGCLITGGEIRRAKLLDTPSKNGRARQAGESEPTTEAAPRLKIVGPVVAALLSIVACVAAILLVHSLLGKPVIEKFIHGQGGMLAGAELPKELPRSWDAFWRQAELQVSLLKRMCETYGELPWRSWRVGLFVYLAACLSIRLAPVRRPIRPALGAVVLIAAVIALIGVISDRFRNLMQDIWPLLTYVWTSLLLLLVVSLIIRGLVSLVRVLAGKNAS